MEANYILHTPSQFKEIIDQELENPIIPNPKLNTNAQLDSLKYLNIYKLARSKPRTNFHKKVKQGSKKLLLFYKTTFPEHPVLQRIYIRDFVNLYSDVDGEIIKYPKQLFNEWKEWKRNNPREGEFISQISSKGRYSK